LAWQRLGERAFRGDADAAARLAAVGELSYTEQLVTWLSQDERRPAAVWALGFSGWPRAAQACLELLDHDDPRTACLAGEAFASITGLPRDDERYWGDTAEERAALEGDELPDLEEDLEAELDLGPEDALPLPRADEIRTWWSDRRERFKPTIQYLLGRPLDPTSLVWALREAAPMRRRPILALLLAAESPNSLWVPTRCSPHLTERRLAAALPPGR
jgi:uncharacterized protein (TIGR02270 family)